MSTEHQQYSPENQLEVIRQYATSHNMEIVQEYSDHGRSGLNIAGREGLNQLMSDVENKHADFSALLVYDVSRWGCFQDVDESAYYEYVLKRAGIRVHYCAEQFENDNARTHSNHQIRQIARSITEFGFTNPILLGKNNTIVAGHGRLLAAQILGMERVPTIRLETLTQSQIRAYVLADNQLALNAGWDKSILALEFEQLLAVNDEIDITVTGFEVAEIDLILQDAAQAADPEDEFPIQETGPAVTQPGDLWQLGKHRVLCGNSLQESSYTLFLSRKGTPQIAARDFR